MLEQYLGAERFRQGVSHYLRQHAVREHRDQRPVGRHRGDQRRAGAADDGLVDLAARLPARHGVARRRRPRAAPAALRLRRPATLDADAEPTTWLVPVHVRAGGDGDDRAARRRRGPGRRSPTRPRRSSSTPAATASSASPTTTSCASRITGEVLGSLDTLERYNLVDDAWNEVVAGRLAAADFLAFVEGFGGERELAVWQAIVLGLRGLGRLLDDDAYPAFQARVRALLAPVVADLGDPVDGEDDLRAKLRGLLVGALAVQGDDAATQATGRGAVRAQPRPTRAASTPSSSPRRRRSSPPPATRPMYERMLDGYRTAATPQDQLRHLYALAEFDDEALVLRTCELAMSGEVKTQNAPFLLRLVHRQPPPRRRRRGRSCASTGTRPTRRSRSNTIVRMVDSVKLLTDERGRRRRAGVLRRAPDRAGRQDARPDPRAPAGQHRPAGPRAGALRRRRADVRRGPSARARQPSVPALIASS